MSDLIYLDCPKCHMQIREPFTRGVVTVWLHRPRHRVGGGRSCRLLIVTAVQGDEHHAWPIPDAMPLEDALLHATQGDEMREAA